MKRFDRIAVMFLVAAGAASISLYLGNIYIASLTTDAAKAAVAAGEITLFGVIFSALYKEISTYYTDRSANISKKWELILPLIKAHYVPWINAATSLRASLKRIDPDSIDDAAIKRFLFLNLVFFGIRMRFIDEDGGLIFLSSMRDEKAAMSAYRSLEEALDWADSETPKRVTHLQGIFMKEDKKGKRYLLDEFEKDVQKDSNLQDDIELIRKWISKEHKEKAITEMNTFIDTFQVSIDRLYNAWSDE